MINNLSQKLTEKLLSNGTINEEDKELYIYGLFMLLSHCMFLIITCILGLILNCLLESIIFYVAFMLIRRYAGGYHASTETRCEVMSTLSIIASLIVIRLSGIYDFKIILAVIALLSAVLIICLSPLDTPEKPLSEKEFKYFRKITLIILAVILLPAVLSYIFNLNFAFAPLCMSLILESILLLCGKIKRVHESD